MSAARRQPTSSLGKYRRHWCRRAPLRRGWVHSESDLAGGITAGRVQTEKPRKSGRNRPLDLRHLHHHQQLATGSEIVPNKRHIAASVTPSRVIRSRTNGS
jgi:hypothetical protein